MFLQVICKNGAKRLLNLRIIQSISYFENQKRVIFTLEKEKDIIIEYHSTEQAQETFERVSQFVQYNKGLILH